VYGTVRTVVWEDGGGNPASYPRPRSSRHPLHDPAKPPDSAQRHEKTSW
jgi:hypothetical protein